MKYMCTCTDKKQQYMLILKIFKLLISRHLLRLQYLFMCTDNNELHKYNCTDDGLQYMYIGAITDIEYMTE